MKHKHHIIPKYEGGSDFAENLVELTPTQHAMWHFAEWQRKGNEEDRIAWRGLAGWQSKADIIAELNHARAVAWGEARRGKKHSEATRLKMSKAKKGVPKSEAHRAALSRANKAYWRGKNQSPSE